MVDIDVWAQNLAHHLQEHMDTEREALREYAHLAEEKNDRVRFLIQMILDDEVRHHRIFQDMVNWIRAEHAQRDDMEPKFGSLSIKDEDPQHLLELTDQLLELEREDESELKELNKVVTEVADTAWWTVLVDSMRHDTRKHIMLLEAVKKLVNE